MVKSHSTERTCGYDGSQHELPIPKPGIYDKIPKHFNANSRCAIRASRAFAATKAVSRQHEGRHSGDDLMIPNQRTTEGIALGEQMARLCDVELAGKPDNRCETCAFRKGDHLANGSPETLMSAVKCCLERTPFWCHEQERPCAGWLAMRAPSERTIEMPWDHVHGSDGP